MYRLIKNTALDKEGIIQELNFKAVRSSGPGGQNVNKVATKVALFFDLQNSNALTAIEKDRISQKLASKLTKEGILMLQCDESRSQHKNKALVIKRFLATLTKALRVAKPRKKTRPSRSAIAKRLNNKKKAAQKKANRAKPNLE